MAQAYQALAARNAERLSASIQSFAAVKNPAELVELQKRMIAESVDAVANDWSSISKLTIAVFITAFDPLQQQLLMFQNSMKT
ncbi:hypothetical protein CCP1ISM_3400002 [Azospirillaceae bacterium]